MSESLSKSLSLQYFERVKSERERAIAQMKFEYARDELIKIKIKESEVKNKDLLNISNSQNIMIQEVRKNLDNEMSGLKTFFDVNIKQFESENSDLKEEYKLIKGEINAIIETNIQLQNNIDALKKLVKNMREEFINKEEKEEKKVEEAIGKQNQAKIEMEKELIFLSSEKTKNIWQSARFGRLPAVKFWLKKDSSLINKIENEEYKCTPLHHAVANNHLHVTKYLIEKGADVNATNELLNTPLHFATTYYGNLNLVQYLIEKGANYHLQNHIGDTPLKCAYLNKFTRIVRYLKSLK